MSEIEQEQQSTQSLNLPIDWYVSDNIQRRYASNVFVQSGEYEIILSFFEPQLPFLTGTPEENRAKLEELGAIRANCVAQIVVHPDLVPKIINALQVGHEKYLEAKGELTRSQENDLHNT